MRPSIAIVILNWNGVVDTLECLRSVHQIAYDRFSTMVVDNASADDSVARIAKAFPNVILLKNARNLGYAEGNNVGIRAALHKGADFVLLLNNDTIVDENILTRFIAAAQEYPEAGVFAAKIYYHARPDTIWFAGGVWNKETSGFCHIGKDALDIYHEAREIDYSTGCALFFRREVVENAGLLDPTYFLTFEETDWCYRARRAGFKIMFVPGAKVWHKVSVSFGGDASPLYSYYDSRNRLLWAKKNLRPPERWRVYKRTLTQARTVSSHGMQRLVRAARFRGILDFILRRLGECPRDIYTLNREYAAMKEKG